MIPPEITALSNTELLEYLSFPSFEAGIQTVFSLFLNSDPSLSLLGLESLEKGYATREFVHRVLVPQGAFSAQQTDLFQHWYLDVFGCLEEIVEHNANNFLRVGVTEYQGEHLAPAFLLTDAVNYAGLFSLFETCPIVYREVPQIALDLPGSG